MFSPSAAPRWKIITSFFPCACAVVAWANTLRVRNEGTAEAPTTAIAPPFMNARRVRGMRSAPVRSKRQERGKSRVEGHFCNGIGRDGASRADRALKKSMQTFIRIEVYTARATDSHLKGSPMKVRSTFCFPLATFAIVLALLMSSVPAHAQNQNGQGKILAGFFEEWSIYYANYNLANLESNGSAAKLSHLIYAFGDVSASAPGPSTATSPRFSSSSSFTPNSRLSSPSAAPAQPKRRPFRPPPVRRPDARPSPPPASTCSSWATWAATGTETSPRRASSTALTSTGNSPLPPTSRTSPSCSRSSAASSTP